MLRGSGSSVIPITVFLAILLIVLPVGADNVTTQTTNATPTITIATTQIINATPLTTVTPRETTVAVTRRVTVVTTSNPTMSVEETETTGTVLIYSSPSGASILIDGVYRGATPVNVNGVPAGNHILRLSLSGYYDYEGSIYIVPGQTSQGYGTLQPMNQVMSAAPTPVPTVIDPVIVPVVTATPEPTQVPGLFGNPSIIVALIGMTTVLIAAGTAVFIYVKPPKKE
ncbi:MAG: PEGA domain-containing protein [Methanoregula sp.]